MSVCVREMCGLLKQKTEEAESRGRRIKETTLNKGRSGEQEGRRGNGEITRVLVLVLALIPPNVPGIKGGVHPFSLTLTIAL